MSIRNTFEVVQKALSRQASLALIGPRQVGKTTLALQIGARQNALYLDLEAPEERDKLSNGFVAASPTAFWQATKRTAWTGAKTCFAPI